MPAQQYASHVEKVHAQVEGRAPARSAIAASWARSMFHHGLEPDLRRPQDLLSQSELRFEQQRLDRLLHIAKPIMENLFTAVVKTGCCVMLTNKDSVVLHRLIHDVDERPLNVLGARSGAIWSEQRVGTNGVGTCALEERPVLIYKDQHYLEEIIGMSCAGAPIFDASGDLIAVLDISSARDDMNDSFAQMMASLVISAANRIETEYFRASFDGARIIVADEVTALGTPLLASDRDDLVIGANRAARRLYGLQHETFDIPLPRTEILPDEAPALGLKDAERAAIRRAMAAARGNATLAAKQLGVSRATFYRLLKKHQLSS
ncbi:GAF domain-containing protein [Neptunicoccus sediminis]|uniref:GAF domain-containing protein n=1 Tax=Neptunicoccus sediminis TaxID=1892596 RepID=UPI000845DE81|nr:GAF domain-containing protein [Neptunicoccus sediminis]